MKSNIDDIGQRIQEFVASINFDHPGVDGSLGVDCAHAVAEAIAETAAVQHTTDGEKFPDNEDKYAKWKDKKYGVGNPAYGRRTGQMLSLQSLLGKVEVSADRVTMTYGTGEPPERSSASGYISKGDKATTDKQKADLLHAKMHGFYKPGWYGRERVKEVVREAVERAVQDENSR